VKALRLLFVFAASVPERVAAAALTIKSAALPVVKSIGLFALVSFSLGVDLGFFLLPFLTAGHPSEIPRRRQREIFCARGTVGLIFSNFSKRSGILQ
jgi:hypothetical protein